jgi:soluble lytic murein transglycosylase
MWPPGADAVPLPKPRPIPRNVMPKTIPLTESEKPQIAAAPATLTAPAADTSAVPPPPRGAASKKPSAPAALTSTLTTPQADLDALENVIELSRKGKTADATQTLTAIGDPIARKLGEWVILRSGGGIPFERYRAFINGNPSWPSQTFLRRRAEGALWDDRREDSLIIGWFDNETPLSAKGKLALARAMLNRGDRRAAEKLVRDAWRNDAMSGDLEEAALEMFGSLITPGDHKVRMDTLLYDEENTAAMRAAKRLGAGQVALAKARIAVNDKASNSKAALDAVPHDLHKDPGYILAKIQYLRRQEKHAEAAQLMMSAPRDPALLHNTNEWWIERRLLARKLLDDGDNRSAYIVARDAAPPARDIYRTEHEFTAGWIALRFLNDPATAAQHFARIGTNTRNPTAIARAGYWQGRAAEAMGRSGEARSAYQTAAAQSTSYYGQLARAKLGLPQLALHDAPASRRGSEKFEIVRAVEILYALEEGEVAIPIFSDMGERAEADVLAALSELASKNGDARAQLIAGKAALNRGLPFDFHAYPVNGIPPFKPIGPDVERSIVYAIARQESAFHPTIVSPANAYGLMQVTAGAGKTVTKKYGVGFDLGRLKSDPVYNATLGAAELGTLIEDYRGSYILTFAAYNAGRGSVKKWLARYGDPRDPKVDAVDWVERIPFSETRNYVQRIMENVQVYRTRFGGGTRLQIDADLRRGVAAAE